MWVFNICWLHGYVFTYIRYHIYIYIYNIWNEEFNRASDIAIAWGCWNQTCTTAWTIMRRWRHFICRHLGTDAPKCSQFATWNIEIEQPSPHCMLFLVFHAFSYTFWSFNIAIENGHLWRVLPIEIMIFHSYVELPDGMCHGQSIW